jgi:hypothetical protein
VFVLGTSHDLTGAVEQLGGGTTENISVNTKTVGSFAGSSAIVLSARG